MVVDCVWDVIEKYTMNNDGEGCCCVLFYYEIISCRGDEKWRCDHNIKCVRRCEGIRWMDVITSSGGL
jgi:hypothetical protein